MTKHITVLVMVVAATFLGLQMFDFEESTRLIRPLIAPLLIVLYLVKKVNKRSNYLLGFLLLYSISELMEYTVGYVSKDFLYFFCNSLYIISYLFLTLEIYSNIKFKAFFKTHIFQVLILLIFDIICVKILTDFTNFELGFTFLMELTYNIVIMVMISLAMLNFFSRTTNKSMNLLIGVFCLVSSEIIAVAYHYIDNKLAFSNAYSILYIIGLFFVFRQSYLEHQEFKFFEQPLEDQKVEIL